MKEFLTQYRIKRNILKRGRQKLGYTLNLKKPQTYCEKIQWLKLNVIKNNEAIAKNSDKLLVRDHIKSCGFEDNLIPLLGHWDSAEKINWEELPNRFVLKFNNASGKSYYWFIKDKSQHNLEALRTEIAKKFSHRFGQRMGEFQYQNTETQLIAEAFLDDEGSAILDYKFYCFNGEIAFFSVESGQITGKHVRDYYNLEWQSSFVDFYQDIPRPETPFQKPDNFDHMVRMATELSKGYPHIRVDLYNIKGKVYFGELTYTPECGFTCWKPRSMDLEYGKRINIEDYGYSK